MKASLKHGEALTARRVSPAARPGYRSGHRPANAGKTYPVEVLTPAEVESLLAACSRRSVAGLRNRALIATLYRAGLRLGETLALEPKDLDPAAGTITVLHGKGNRRRVVGIDPGGAEILTTWIERRASLDIAASAPLFCTLAGRPLQPSYVRTLLPRLARAASVQKRVHPHGLRHTHAAELAREGVPMPLIQQQLGHASLATTDRYLRHLAPTELVAAIQKRTWHEGYAQLDETSPSPR